MQKWEYTVLEFSPLTSSSRVPSEYQLNDLGSQGWKISASGGMGHSTQGILGAAPSFGWIILMREKS